MVRQIDQQGRDAIKRFEACRLTAYRDAVGVWTIGWGSTRGVSAGMTITREQAEARFTADLRPAESAVERLVTVPLADNQFAALVSFVFNVGEGTFRRSWLLKELNEGRYEAVPAELARFRFAHGRELPGLVTRRAAEATLWTHGHPAPPARTPAKPIARATSGPSSAPASDPQPTTQRIDPMGALTALSSIFGLVQTFGPLIPEVVAEVPDIATKAGKLVGDVKAMDVSDSIADLEALVASAAIPFHVITKTVEASVHMTA